MTKRARIVGVGRYVPEHVMTNDDLEAIVDTSDEWITDRTGIRERRIAADHESTSSMGAEAARRALASAGLTGQDIDLVVCGTCTADHSFPAAATLIQHEIGAPGAAAFDVNAACNGFMSALSVATQFIASGQSTRVMVVGSEVYSRILDWTDRGTCVLFGDGAGAVIVEATPEGERGSVDALLLRSDGSQAGLLYANGPATPGDAAAREAKVVMNGAAVFKHAVVAMAEASAEVVAQAGYSVEDIDLVVPHQANRRIITALADRLGLPMEKVFLNLHKYGNTSSASIPIALAEAVAEGRLKAGDRVLLAAFGGGLSWGAMTLEWGGVRHPEAATADASIART
ncbi:MAG: ketoacyl-ACP synthase III [Dehalococcoidia bacterium]|nr:ketoacyl-ACP synthase III [Dehalococcoidia bacterium]